MPTPPLSYRRSLSISLLILFILDIDYPIQLIFLGRCIIPQHSNINVVIIIKKSLNSFIITLRTFFVYRVISAQLDYLFLNQIVNYTTSIPTFLHLSCSQTTNLSLWFLRSQTIYCTIVTSIVIRSSPFVVDSLVTS